MADPTARAGSRWTRLRRFLTTRDFSYEREVCGGGAEVATEVSVARFYRRLTVTYVRANRTPSLSPLWLLALLVAANATLFVVGR